MISRAFAFVASLAAPVAAVAADIPGGPGTSAKLAVNASAGSDLGSAPDADWFHLTAQAGKLYAATIRTNPDGVTVGFRVSVKDAAGRVLSAADLYAGREGEASQLNFRPRTAAAHYLEVKLARSQSDEVGFPMPYVVDLVRDVSSGFGDAARLPFGTQVTGVKRGENDVDYYVVRLDKGKPVDVLSQIGGVSDSVVLYDRDRKPLGFVDDRFGKLAYHVPTYTGDHYISVSLVVYRSYTLKVAPADRGGRPTSGDDLLIGTDGPDAIDSLAGGDVVRGLAGADVLRGGLGDDTILGGAGADAVRGSQGFDQLFGDGGDDALTGGRDPDDLRGGPGCDGFLFFGDAARGYDSGSRSDPDPYKQGLDRIHDFVAGDKIDLRGMDADATRAGRQTFRFVGTAAFTGPAQVRYGLEPDGGDPAGTMTVIALNTDADPAPEVEIVLTGRRALRTADFTLRDPPPRAQGR